MNRERNISVQDGFEISSEPVTDTSSRNMEAEMSRSSVVVISERET